MKIKTYKLKLSNLFGINGTFSFIPYLISFLLIGMIISFFINFKVKNVFDLEEKNLYRIITFSIICFFLLVTFIFLIINFKYLGLLIFLINFLFLASSLWAVYEFKTNTFLVLFLDPRFKFLTFISLIFFFYFGIYFQNLFLNFYKKYSNSVISIFSFLKLFFINELNKLKYYFLIILFIITPAFIIEYNEFLSISYILIFLIINSLIVQYFLFLLIITFLFLFFDSFIKKNLNTINFLYTKVNIKNNFFNNLKNNKKSIWIQIIFLLFFIVLSIVMISVIMIIPKTIFKKLEDDKKIISFYQNLLKNITFTMFLPMVYISLRFKLKGLFIYVFLFPIKLILFSTIFFFVLNIEKNINGKEIILEKSMNLNVSLVLITFLLDFLLVEDFLNKNETNHFRQKSKKGIFNQITFFDFEIKGMNKIKILLLFSFIEILLFFNLTKIRFLGFFIILFIILPLLFLIQKILYILTIKVENKFNLKIKKSFSNISFVSGKEEIIKGLND